MHGEKDPIARNHTRILTSCHIDDRVVDTSSSIVPYTPWSLVYTDKVWTNLTKFSQVQTQYTETSNCHQNRQ